MHLSHFSVSNYKSFNSSAELNLKPGINVIVGKNNSGKSALLEALSMAAPPVAHRSFRDGAEVFGGSDSPKVSARFVLAPHEIRKIAADSEGALVSVPLPRLDSPFARSVGYADQSASSLQRFSNWLQTASLEISVVMSGPSVEMVAIAGDQGYSMSGGQPWWEIGSALRGPAAGGSTDAISAQPEGLKGLSEVALALRKTLRFVPASRANALASRIGEGPGRVAADGGNLVAVLDNLGRNVGRADRFKKLVAGVIPEIAHISVRSLGSSNGDVALWEHDVKTERDDLAPSLSHSGTGVTHLLVLLFQTFEEPGSQILLIDELEHSLHPGAVRKLMEIFATDFPKQQFIVTTHSPTAVASPRPVTLSVVRKTDGQSTVQSFDKSELRLRRELLAEIGTSVSDLFGADAVLWVEGATEEICFPSILEKLGGAHQPGTAVIKGLINTGDVEGRDAQRILEIYEKLSGADALLPPAVGFILDDDGRSEQAKKELERRSKNRMRFTKRRMYENYLLNPGAIAFVLSAIEGRSREVSAEEVEKWLEANHTNNKYAHDVLEGVHWRTVVHAGNLLKDLFWELSGQVIAYRKPEHSVEITEFLLKNDPEQLREIAELIGRAMRDPGQEVGAQG